MLKTETFVTVTASQKCLNKGTRVRIRICISYTIVPSYFRKFLSFINFWVTFLKVYYCAVDKYSYL
jgi:hypothetical protein